MRVLVAGWFSFREMGATAGDLLARDVACEWLQAKEITYDIATALPADHGVDWTALDPRTYSHVLFVCGPFGNGPPLTDFLRRFSGRRLVGLDVSMLQPLAAWNPFELLLERDSDRASRPDLSLGGARDLVPVVALVLVHPQSEYGDRARHREADAALRRLVGSHEMAVIAVDTRLDVNGTGLRSAAEVEALIARTDLVLTTRLHGLVLAIKHGVPPIVIDPIAGGAKVLRQAQALDWPVAFCADTVTDSELARAFDYCQSEDARQRARACRDSALARLKSVRDEFVSWFESERRAH